MLASRKPMSVFTTAPANDPAEESPSRMLSPQDGSPVDISTNSRRGLSRNGLFSPLGSSPNLVFRSGSGSNLASEASSPRLVHSSSSAAFSVQSDARPDADGAGAGAGFESSVPMVAAGADILVPMLDRPEEMAELLANPRNARLVGLLNSALGAELYRKAEALWTDTPRRHGSSSSSSSNSSIGMDDHEWLFETRKLLVGTLKGDKVLWRQWCDMVGWDDNTPSPPPAAYLDPEEWNSGASLPPQDTIHEEDEE